METVLLPCDHCGYKRYLHIYSLYFVLVLSIVFCFLDTFFFHYSYGLK